MIVLFLLYIMGLTVLIVTGVLVAYGVMATFNYLFPEEDDEPIFLGEFPTVPK